MPWPAPCVQAYDMLGVVQQVVDDGQVLEIMREYARNMIVGALNSITIRSFMWWPANRGRRLLQRLPALRVK